MDEYLIDQLLLPDGFATTVGGRTLQEWVAQGAVDADDSCCKTVNPIRHFFDPVNDRGLTDLCSNCIDAISWAWNAQDDKHHWVGAREALLEALTHVDPQHRLEQLRLTLENLGWVIHLVEDAAQPQHTRNDAHPPVDLLDSDEYEQYIRRRYNTIGDFPPSMGSMPIPSFQTAIGRDGIPPQFVAFWDTGQYNWVNQHRFSGFPYTPGLAEFSNFYFPSDDTMFTGERVFPNQDLELAGAVDRSLVVFLSPSPADEHRYAFPKLADTNLDVVIRDLFDPSVERIVARVERHGDYAEEPPMETFSIRFEGYGQVIPDYATLHVTATEGGGEFGLLQAEIGLTEQNFEAHAQVLLPRAISYSAGLLNYFFRAKLEVTADFGIMSGLNEVTVTNRGTEELVGTADGWKLFIDDENGIRTPLSNSVDWSGFEGRLDPGESFTIRFPAVDPSFGCAESRICSPAGGDSCGSTGECTLVFRGTIGDEEEIAVAAKRFLLAEVWDGTFYVPPRYGCSGVSNRTVIVIEPPFDGSHLVGSWHFFGIPGGVAQGGGSCVNGAFNFGGLCYQGELSGNHIEGETGCFACNGGPQFGGPFSVWRVQ